MEKDKYKYFSLILDHMFENLKENDMKIECLIGETYQVTDDSTVWFQGSLSDCFAYMCKAYLDQ